MRFRVHVSLKASVLDPQGQTIRAALNGQGHHVVADVRQGKYFDIEITPETGLDQARAEVELIARDVLANPVIEDFRVEELQ